MNLWSAFCYMVKLEGVSSFVRRFTVFIHTIVKNACEFFKNDSQNSINLTEQKYPSLPEPAHLT